MFENKLQNIKSHLVKQQIEKKTLSKLYVAQRLNKSLDSYMKDLEDRIKYLEQRKPENVLRKL